MRTSKIFFISMLFTSIFVFSQNTTNAVANETVLRSYFYDASGNTFSAANVGKGLNFPRTPLTTFEFDLQDLGNYQYSQTAFDGFIVYNTVTGTVNGSGSKSATQGQTIDVTPGFYYFSNPTADEDTTDVSGGQWVRIGGGSSAAAVEYKSTEVATGEKFYTSATTSKDVFVKKLTVNFANKSYADLAATDIPTGAVVLNATLVDKLGNLPINTAAIKTDYAGTTGTKVFATNGSMYTVLDGSYDVIVKYYK